MYARRLAVEVVERPSDMSDATFLAKPLEPSAGNAKALRAYDELEGRRDISTSTLNVLASCSHAPSVDEVRRRRQVRLDPWTSRALASDDGDGATKKGSAVGRKRGKASSKQSDVDAMASERAAKLRAIAKEAMETASKATRLRAQENMRFTEKRKFAGKMVEVETEYVEGSKEAKAQEKRAEILARGGLDAVLAELMGPKKLNVLDKTKADWRGVKEVDADLEEDLQAHARGGKTYREQQDFLQQADYREYELERDARLAAASKRGGR
jgi:predicted Fe-Mo cluster-binding NifX family protein